MKKYLLKILLTILFVVLSTGLIAKIIADDTRMYIEIEPVDFESRGEDVAYDLWLKKYLDLDKNRQQRLSDFSDQYSNDLLKVINKAESSDQINKWRNDFSNDNFKLNAKIITGKKVNSNISYTQDDIKTGGISLTRIKSILEKGSPSGVFVDSGKIYMSIDPEKKESSRLLYPDDIAVLIRGIFQSKDYSIWLTIDPPRNSDMQKIYGEVKYGGLIQNTHVGSVLFEADRIMKCLSIGFDNRTAKPFMDEDWAKSEFEFLPSISVDRKSAQSPEWHRFWFTTEDASVEIDYDSRTVKLVGKPLVIKTERMRMVNGKLVSSFKPLKDTAPQLWTDHFNKKFHKYAEEYPVLKELEIMASWSVLLMALRETGVVFQDFNMPDINYVQTSVRTPVITVIKERTVIDKTTTNKMTKIGQAIIVGGVGFQKMQLVNKDLKQEKSEWKNEYSKGSLLVERIF